MRIITPKESAKALSEFLARKREKLVRMYLDLKYGVPGVLLRDAAFRMKYNCVGAAGEQLNYGYQIKGSKIPLPAVWGASEAFDQQGGAFVKTDGSGRLEIAGSGDTQLIGWGTMDVVPNASGVRTASATEGASVGTLNPCLDAVYRLPIGGSGTLTRAMFYDSCDLIVASNLQSADLTSVEDVIIIVDGDVDNNNWLDCMLNPAKMGVQGVS